MTPWIDAIDKLRSLGYYITLDKGRLRYAYQGKGNPSQKEITPLLDALKAHKEEILNDPYFLIEQTLHETNKVWKTGVITWMKGTRPEGWRKMITLEGVINGATLRKDVGGLRKVLDEYRRLMIEMVEFSRIPYGGTGSLFAMEKNDSRLTGL